MRLVSLLLLLALALAGCVGGPIKRVYPPQATVQELTVLPDGQWLLKVRVQNFSELAMEFGRVEADLQINDLPAGHIDIASTLTVGPGSTEIVDYRIYPDPAVKPSFEARVASRSAVRYRLRGHIHSRRPRGDYPFEYESSLSPTPGLSGVLR